MVTLRQLFRGVRNSKPTPGGFGSPQKKATIVKVWTKKPKKPNSAQRLVVKVEFGDGRKLTAFAPGEKHNLREHSKVLIRGGGAQDLPGSRTEVIPGALDSPGIEGRKTARSRYGTPRPKK